MIEFELNSEFIKLDQLLKATNIVATGGEAKGFISEGNVLVNGETETRRGRKIYKDFVIELKDVKNVKILVR